MQRLAAFLLLAAPLMATACDIRCQFNDFKVKYGRVYATPEEEEYRFGVFVGKMAEAERLNAENPEATYGVTKFSDMTKEEFRRGVANYDSRKRHVMGPIPELQESPRERSTLPTTYTSEYVSAIMNQGNCGSCWAFAVTEALDSAWYKATGSLLSFSPQQLVDCDTTDGGCDGGWPNVAAEYFVTVTKAGGGAMLLSDYSYTSGTTGKAGSCSYSKSKAVGKLSSYSQKTWGESTMDQTVYDYGPVVVTLNADSIDTYTSGIVTTTSACTSLGYPDHAVVLVGWGVSSSNVAYWVIQNSWGTDWGESGFFRVKRGVGTCLLTTDAAVILVSPSTSTTTASSDTTQVVTVSSAVTPVVGQSSSNGLCTAKSNPCGSRVCGTVSNGCGGTVVCGTCKTGKTCTSSGKCRKSSVAQSTTTALSEGSSKKRSANVFQWSSGSDANDYDNLTTVQTGPDVNGTHFLRWDDSADLVGDNGTTMFTAMVNASSQDGGFVGLGCRMGQSTGDSDGVWMTAEPMGNGTAAVRVHQTRGGKSTNYSMGNLTWNDEDMNNITLRCSVGNESIEIRLWVNNETHGKACAVNISGYKDSGSMFIVANGANKTFSDMSLGSYAELSITTGNCISTGDMTKQIAQMSGVLPSTVAVNISSGGSCSDTCTNDSTACGNKMKVGFSDSRKVARYGYVVGTPMDLPQLASQISLHAQELISEGALDAVGIEVASLSVVPATVAAEALVLELPAVAADAAGAALSTGAIIGIAVGGGAAVVLAVGGATTAAVVIAKKRSSNKGAEAESGEAYKQAPVRNTLQRFVEKGNGVDVMNAGAEHSSITGRAPPVELSS